jgi:hypothetical protein
MHVLARELTHYTEVRMDSASRSEGSWELGNIPAAQFTHVPISLAASARKKIDPDGSLWSSVLASTGQLRDMRGSIACCTSTEIS